MSGSTKRSKDSEASRFWRDVEEAASGDGGRVERARREGRELALAEALAFYPASPTARLARARAATAPWGPAALERDEWIERVFCEAYNDARGELRSLELAALVSDEGASDQARAVARAEIEALSRFGWGSRAYERAVARLRRAEREWRHATICADAMRCCVADGTAPATAADRADRRLARARVSLDHLTAAVDRPSHARVARRADAA